MQNTYRWSRVKRAAFAFQSASALMLAPFMASADTSTTALLPQPAPLELSALQVQEAASAAAPAQAFDIRLMPGPKLNANPAAKAAFERAARQWEQRIRDPITVTIYAELGTLLFDSLAFTLPVGVSIPYDLAAHALKIDAADEAADAIVLRLPEDVAALQTRLRMPTVSIFGFPTVVQFNGNIRGTKANMKALGFTGLDEAFLSPIDAYITFHDVHPFDYYNLNGVAPGTYDFETLAAHEIGHALGFVSIMDVLEIFPAASDGVGTLDLFRFADRAADDPMTENEFTTFPRTMIYGEPAHFDDIRRALPMSTGQSAGGDGRQAGHWKDDELMSGPRIGLMDPTQSPGEVTRVAEPDLLALDLIGYEIDTSGQ